MGSYGLYIIIALAFGAMWLMSSRTRKQQQAAQEFRNTLAPGDEVMTGSGLFGTVVDVEGDVITLESTPGSRTRWLRAAISKKIDPVVEIGEAEDDEEELIDVPDDISSLEALPESPSTRPTAPETDAPVADADPTDPEADRTDPDGGTQTK